jgi:DNA-binding NarL/FixJ family response regulator
LTRILIADDHEVVRSGLRSILEAQSGWKIVAEAADGREAIARAVESNPDVAIIDYALPMMNGLEVTRQIRLRVPTAEVLIFTIHESKALVSDLLRAGAKAYLLKSDATRHLVAAVRSLAAHEPYFSIKQSEWLLKSSLAKTGRGASIDDLSPRERVVVQLVVEGGTNKQIAALLDLSQKTVETHRAKAMRKLGVNTLAGLVRYAVRNRLIEP